MICGLTSYPGTRKGIPADRGRRTESRQAAVPSLARRRRERATRTPKRHRPRPALWPLRLRAARQAPRRPPAPVGQKRERPPRHADCSVHEYGVDGRVVDLRPASFITPTELESTHLDCFPLTLRCCAAAVGSRTLKTAAPFKTSGGSRAGGIGTPVDCADCPTRLVIGDDWSRATGLPSRRRC